MAKKTDRKTRVTKSRLIAKEWDASALYELKVLADELAQLYPAWIGPLLETDDLAGHFLNRDGLFSITSAVLDLGWCMHIAPPYRIEVKPPLGFRLFKAEYVGQHQDSSDLDIGACLGGGLDHGLVELVHKSFLNKCDDENDSEIKILEDMCRLFRSIHIQCDQKFDKTYLIQKSKLAENRRVSLNQLINKISKNKLIESLLGNTKFKQSFEGFYQYCGIYTEGRSSVELKVVQYRYLAHIIILFLRVAGEERGVDYTLEAIKSYRGVIRASESPVYKNIRSVLESTPVNMGPPKADELKSIKGHAEALFKLLNGRTESVTLLNELSNLMEADTDYFTSYGKAANKTNLEVRAFIKSLVAFMTWLNGSDQPS